MDSQEHMSNGNSINIDTNDKPRTSSTKLALAFVKTLDGMDTFNHRTNQNNINNN